MKRRPWPFRRRRKERKPPWIVRLLRRRGVRLSPRGEWALGWLETLVFAGVAAFLIISFVTVRMSVPTGSMIPAVLPGDSFFVDRVSYYFTEPDVGDIIVFWFLEELRVRSVEQGSPAAQAGIAPGDVVRMLGGEPIPSMRTVTQRIEAARGGEVAATVLRQGRFIDVSLNVPTDATDLRSLGIAHAARRVRYVKRLVAVGGQTVHLHEGRVHIDGQPLDEVAELGLTYWTGDVGMRYGVQPSEIPEGHYFVLGDNTRDSYDSRYWGFVPVEELIGAPFFRVWPLGRFGPMNGYFWSSRI